MKRVIVVLFVLSALSQGLIAWSRPKAAGRRIDSFGALGQQRKSRPRRVRPKPAPPATPLPPPEQFGPAGPFIRVALAMDVPSAAITCDGDIGRLEEEGQKPIRLARAEVHLEPAPSPEGPSRVYRIRVAVVRDPGHAEWLKQRLQAQFRQPVTVKLSDDGKDRLLYIGEFQSERDAFPLARRLKWAGYRDITLVDEMAPPKPILVAREASGAVLFQAPRQIVLAPMDERHAPLRFNGRTYRGRFVVRLNQHGRLLVMNELPLEEYLWSVVPQALNPTAFPALEALKAQAVAARTYAVWKKLNAMDVDGYDVVARSPFQTYTGMEAEHPLSTRAVNETRGLIVTYDGQPIEAVYTATCGGRTEDAQAVFGRARPYLRSVLCAPERQWLEAHTLITERPVVPQRGVALLQLVGLTLPGNVTMEFLDAPAMADEVASWLEAVARFMGRSAEAFEIPSDRLVQLSGLAQAIIERFYPPDYLDALFTPADVTYLLDYADGTVASPEARAALAALISDGILSPSLLRPSRVSDHLSRGQVLRALARLVERRGRMPIETGRVRLFRAHRLIIESEQGEARAYPVSASAFLFKRLGSECVPVNRLIIVGGERVWFHRNAAGEIDYVELEPNPQGAARDRYSPVSRWNVRRTPAELRERLSQQGIDVGEVIDVRVLERDAAQRVTRLEIIGSHGRKTLSRSQIRTALGVHETLFVVDRRYDPRGRIAAFIFTGRGWGHGVGLCQMGAYGLALEGASFSDILKTYYTGVKITRIY
ncbi:MAG: SpoIID/LytB domain-containing protein [Acidobacteria bacterium]|nr:MAG: SpoIID/LytB domain-containing protein [Acidobacteriota bacterium]